MKERKFASDLAAVLAKFHPAIRGIILTPSRPPAPRPVIRKPVKTTR